MKRLILFGAPGSGKGTMGDLIQRDFNYVKISTGDILRSAIQQDSADGRQAKSFMESGGLVPDELVIELVRRRLERGDLVDGYVMDGYPRTLAQAEALSHIASESEKAIFIEVSEVEAIERLLSRLTCSECGAIYNLINKPPKKDGTCDLCRGRVARRADDNEEAVRQRFRVYGERTMPVIEYYGRKNVLERVDGGGAAALVYEKIKGLIA
ncbi:MAG: nucleoside monophosphate kinase [Candidatus Aminicenantes bacterium]|nr:nucleoside monophosphate kinase [Acidobacteriota bacterium]MCG2810617.1 nucleoside monophosphate kinase [Candidatus Aminicenantes bacterium]